MQVRKAKQGYKLVKSLFGKYEEIPEQWNIKQINSLGRIVTGSTPSTSIREFYDGQFLWATPPDLESVKYVYSTQTKLSKKGFEQTRKLPPGSVLVTCIGTVGRTGIGIQEMATNQQINSVITTGVDHEFLYYQLSYNHKKIKNMANQAVVPILNKTDFGTIKVLIPESEKEQQKIASVLSNVDSLINQTKKIIEQTQKLKKGLMQKLLVEGIGHAKFKKVKSLFGKYAEIPEEWNHSKMKDVCKKISVGIATSTTKYFIDNGVPLIRNQNIKDGYIETNDLLHITKQFAKINESKKLNEGDVVCMRTGYPGQSAVVPSEMNGWQTFTTLIVRPNHKILDSNYLSMFMNSIGRKQITSVQAGAAQQNLNAGWLSNMSILIPPLKEQQKIASILSNIDSEIRKEQKYKSHLETLKKGLMQKLLTGQIRVKV